MPDALTPTPAVPPQEPGVLTQGPADDQHVKILAVLYFVMSGLALFGTCIGFVYIMLGVALRSDAMAQASASAPSDVQEMKLGGAIMGIAGGVVVLISVLAATLHLLTGFFLLRHVHRTFCLVVAGITCLSIPLGTVVGVVTIVVLVRPTVRAMFEAPEAG